MRSIVLQFCVTGIVVFALTVVTMYSNFRSPLILLFLIGVPVTVAIFGNRDLGVRAFMSLVLFIWAWIACGMTGTLLGD